MTITESLNYRIARHRATNEWAKLNHKHYTSTDYAVLIPIIEELVARLAIARTAVKCGKTIRDTFGGNVGGGADVFEEALAACDLNQDLRSRDRYTV